jgi:hypothetical protein
MSTATNLTFLAASAALVLTACKKDEEDPPVNNTPTTGTVHLSLGFHWGDPDFVIGQTYTDGAGHAIQVNALKFFLSETHLENSGSIIADFHDSFILADAAEEGSFILGAASPGSFDHVEIVIGLDSATNHADPTMAEAPLDDASMHWSWNPAAGYKFLLLEGRVDDDGDGVVDSGDPTFTYHCATDDAIRLLSAAHAGTITAGAATSMHVHLHVDQLVNGVDMLATQMGMGYEPINAQLMDNLAASLEVE